MTFRWTWVGLVLALVFVALEYGGAHDFESRADHGVWIIAALAVLAGVILDLALARWRRKDRRGEL